MELVKRLDDYLLQVVNAGIRKIAIYPFGNVGKMAKRLLNQKYHIEETVIYDKNEFYKEKVLPPERIPEFDTDICYLIATERGEIQNEIVSFLLNRGIHDTKILKPFKLFEDFYDDDHRMWSIQKKQANEERYRDYRILVEQTRSKYKLNKQKSTICNPKVIVSLTSYPERIHGVYQTVETLLKQSFMPDKIILWLAYDEFPDWEGSLPDNLLKLENDLFEIAWCMNYKSYKKLVPTLVKYPDDIIVTADDDLLYHRDWLKLLYDSYLKYPDDIQCHRVTKIVLETNGIWKTIPGGFNYYSGSCALNKLTGGSGALYPPNALYQDVIMNEVFMSLAPTSDDIWFWLMGLLNGRKVRVPRDNIAELNINPSMAGTSALSYFNDNGERFFWRHFHNIINTYPELDKILKKERPLGIETIICGD